MPDDTIKASDNEYVSVPIAIDDCSALAPVNSPSVYSAIISHTFLSADVVLLAVRFLLSQSTQKNSTATSIQESIYW